MLVSQKKELYVYQEKENIVPVAKAKKALNVKLRIKCLIVLLMVAFMAMFITVRSENIVRKGYELVTLKAQIIKLEKQNAELKLEIAALKSPQRIKQIATNQLGMITPQNMYCVSVAAQNDNNTDNNKTIFAKTLALLSLNKQEADKGR